MSRLDRLAIILTATQIAALGCGIDAISSQPRPAEVRAASTELPANTPEEVARLVNEPQLRQWRDQGLSENAQVIVIYFLGKKVPAEIKRSEGIYDYALPNVGSQTINSYYRGETRLNLGEVLIFEPANDRSYYRQRFGFSQDNQGQLSFLPIDRAATFANGGTFADEFNDVYATLSQPDERSMFEWNRSGTAPRLKLLPQK
jgi:hypothetical protein